MKARPGWFTKQTRPQWWSAWLSLCLVLVLIAPPTQLCSLMESMPGHGHAGGHSHAGGHGHDTHQHGAHRHDPGAHDLSAHETNAHQHDATHQEAGPAARHAPRAEGENQPLTLRLVTLQSVPEPHACCSGLEAPPVVTAGRARFAAPDAGSAGVSYMPAILPVTPRVFALAGFHGRDGPSRILPLSQLSCASLSGRAPPVAV